VLEASESFLYVLFISEFYEHHGYHHLFTKIARSPAGQPGGQFILRPASRW
jgi:hypothetical protein